MAGAAHPAGSAPRSSRCAVRDTTRARLTTVPNARAWHPSFPRTWEYRARTRHSRERGNPESAMKRQYQSLVAGLLVLGILTGCSRSSVRAEQQAPELTPTAFTALNDKEKVRAKDVIVRVPDTWGGTMLPLDRGPF